MNEERYLILKMLEEGKITADEAAALLEALEGGAEDYEGATRGESGSAGWGGPDAEAAEPRVRRHPRHRRPHRPHRFWHWRAGDIEAGMDALRRAVEKARLEAVDFGDEVSRRVREAIERSQWDRGGPGPFRHWVRQMADVFSVPVGRERHEEETEREVQLPAGGRVRVGNRVGDVRVRAWDRDTVKVKALKQVWAGSVEEARERARDWVIEVTEQGDVLTVWTRLADEAPGWPTARCRVTYDIMVPAAAGLEVCATNGDVEVEGVHGGVDLRLTNGDARADRVAGRVRVSSTNGDLKLRRLEPADLSLNTTNGDITLDLTGLGAGRHEITTARGDVQVTLPSDLAVDLSCSTAFGEIELGVAAAVVHRTGTTLEARLGPGQDRAGEAPVRLAIRAGLGEIRVGGREGLT